MQRSGASRAPPRACCRRRRRQPLPPRRAALPPCLLPPTDTCAAAPQAATPSYHTTFDSELSGGASSLYGSAPVQLPPVTHIGDVIPLPQRPTSSSTSSEAPRRPSNLTIPEDDADSG